MPPRLAAGVVKGRRALFASWNGATDVAAWQLRYGQSPRDLQEGAVTARDGFETSLPRPVGARYADVIALARSGRTLARSKPLRL